MFHIPDGTIYSLANNSQTDEIRLYFTLVTPPHRVIKYYTQPPGEDEEEEEEEEVEVAPSRRSNQSSRAVVPASRSSPARKSLMRPR